MTAIDILLEELRALYGLVAVRISALEQRAVIAWGLVIGMWGAFGSLSEVAQASVLVGVPILAPLFLHTTAIHAQSSEDAFRRLEEIETEINRRAGEPLLQFQTRHPSRGRSVGGRIGMASVSMMAGALVVLLVSCLLVVVLRDPPAPLALVIAYGVIVGAAITTMAFRLRRLRQYRYVKPSVSPSQLAASPVQAGSTATDGGDTSA